MFSEIKDIDTEYTPPAVYYFSQIAYEQKMYQTAMEGFIRLKDDETFGSIVPFYIVQILYLQKDYDGILTMAPELLKSAGKERGLWNFTGSSGMLITTRKITKRLFPILKNILQELKQAEERISTSLDIATTKPERSIKQLKFFWKLVPKMTFLARISGIILGDCYLQKGDKKRAQFGFGEASKLDFDKKIKEESLFNYAKLTYELGYSPFGEAIACFSGVY